MLKLRPQKFSDAERYFEILSSPRFTYFPVVMKSVMQEREWLRKSLKGRKKGQNANFAIVHAGRVVGAIGYHRAGMHAHVAEIGYFLDETCWGKGLVVKAVRMIEATCERRRSTQDSKYRRPWETKRANESPRSVDTSAKEY